MVPIARLLEFFKFLYDCKLGEFFYRIFDITDVRMKLPFSRSQTGWEESWEFSPGSSPVYRGHTVPPRYCRQGGSLKKIKLYQFICACQQHDQQRVV